MGFLRMHALTRRDGAAFLRGSACLFAFMRLSVACIR